MPRPAASLPVAHRLALALAGMVGVAVGVASLIRAALGVAPYDVLTTGLAEATGWPIGLAATILPAALTVVGTLIGRRPGLGTILAVVLIGPMLGATLEVLPESEALAVRVPVFVLGFAVLSVAITAIIAADLGEGPAELVMMAIAERGHGIAATRTAMEVVCVAVGWLLGGQVGVGTLVVAVLLGPVLRRTLAVAGVPAAAAPPAGPAPAAEPA